MDELRHIDILTRANRQILEQMRAMKIAGDAMADRFVGREITVKDTEAIAEWQKSTAAMGGNPP